MIDRSEAAYTVFLAVPTNARADRLEQLRQKVSEQEDAALTPWDEFLETRAELFDSRILEDEYPGSRAREGIVELLRRYPWTPFGLTWNGGLAVTFRDYEHAKRTHRAYTTDPDAYARPTDSRADPVNPRAHLGPLLGWR